MNPCDYWAGRKLTSDFAAIAQTWWMYDAALDCLRAPVAACEDTDPAWIGTYTGRRVLLEYPCAEAIDLRDVAHALAGISRYTGHGDAHYSVAQHSVIVSRLCSTFAGKRAGLLHDGPEAYLGDVSSPLKRLLPDYREIEARWQRAFAARFDVDFADAEVARWDHAICAAEMFYNGPRGSWPMSDWLPKVRFGGRLEPLPAPEAEALFLAEAERLGIR